ncbi:MAG: NDMA-dependent alcohol dehydrogenase [Actinomycetota bacterium]|nr:NDMA-dependent alcohol dehydrogenase [Actinomycetota bacterium]
MKTQAAVLWEVGKEWSVEEVELGDPLPGEVRVKLASSGLCHSDEHLLTGDLPAALPMVGGHEGAGIVEAVGAGVTSLAEGDHVVLSFIPSCGRCAACSTGHQNLCELGSFLVSGVEIAGGQRIHARGQGVGTMCCLGTFSPYVVAHESSAIKIRDDVPLDKASLVGCGVTTGYGSAVYAAGVRAGHTAVVVGCGGIGINAIQGARITGAQYIVAVDPVAFKRESAMLYGATHTIPSLDEAYGLVQDLTWGRMANSVIVTTGVADGQMMAQVMAVLGKNGTAVVTALGRFDRMDVNMSLLDLTLYEKSLRGALFGSANPRFDIPRILDLYMDGILKLDELVTRTYPLSQVNEGYQDMRDGRNLRGMIVFD